ncbi:pentatricopeptide repeat-containing protein At1g05600-like [Mercurialis annua]|uniref:pentatricopeptide repeat-containing protein At1g05600-like n=1 Tax=Mercurialis annua TaxID=3986 RepID=UPI00215DDC86|nr:pentatricopeptide repeat-containing protein At1g05600-like [Mercurialis annua]
MSVRWPRILTPTHLSQIIKSQKNPLTALHLFNQAKHKYPNYHHNGPVYATMISILGNSGRISEMKDVIGQMQEDSCECKDKVFANAIKTYTNAGLLNEAISLFKSIPQFNCVNWTESFNTLLQILVRESKLESAHRLFLENSCGWEVKSRVRSLNLLMDVLCQCNRSDFALQIFEEMNYQGCYPDRDSYRIVMSGLCKDGRLNEATHLLYSMFWRISLKGSGEDIVIYRILLDALCDNDMVEEALDVLGKILRKGLKAPKSCHPRLDLNKCNSENRELTKRLINEALTRGAIPSLGSYTAMSIDLYAEGKISQANKVLDETQDRGYRPSLLAYEAKVAALCKEGKVHEAVNVFEVEMVEANCVPNVRLYNILLKGLCELGNSATAVKYLKKMAKQIGCAANKESYCILVNGLCRDGAFIEASRLLEEMLTKSHWPPVDTFNMLIQGLCSVDRQYEAVMWLEEMISMGELPQISLWNSLVSCVCSNIANTEAGCEAFNQLSRC